MSAKKSKIQTSLILRSIRSAKNYKSDTLINRQRNALAQLHTRICYSEQIESNARSMKDINQVTASIEKELSKSRNEKVKKIRQRVNTGSYKIQSLRVAEAIVGPDSTTPKK